MPYKFNGKELDEETGLYYYGARYMQPVASIWYGVDPLAEKYPEIGAYLYCHANPIVMMDPDGMGDYYTKGGYWLGSDGKKNNFANTADYVHVGKNGLVDYNENRELLPLTNSQLLQDAATAYAESSGNPLETYAIAFVHTRNRVAYGESSRKAGIFLKSSNEKRNDNSEMRTAIGAVINAHIGGFDYSYGATMWDGQEQAFFSSDTKSFREVLQTSKGSIKIELHQNTMGWSISDKDYKEWKQNVGRKFRAPQINYMPNNGAKFNKYYKENVIRLKSTVVYGKTIFWKELHGKNIISK